MPHTYTTHDQHPYAWTVPLALLIGIVVSLTFHWPIYMGLIIAYVGSVVYTRRRGFGWKGMVVASLRGIAKLWRVCAVLLLVGGVVALWMDTGTIPALVQLGSSFIHPDNILWLSFLLASALSMVIGSSIATWSVLGPPLLAMTPPHLTPWLAGALVSGGMVGDRSSPMSSSVVLMGAASGVPLQRVLYRLNKTAILPFALTVCAYIVVNQGLQTHATLAASPHGPVPSWLVVAPPLLVILCALVRVPLLMNLAAAFVIGVGLDIYQSHPSEGGLWTSVWAGNALPQGGHFVHTGGVFPMVAAVLLIATAGAFQGITALGGSIDSLTLSWFDRVHGKWTFVLSSYAVCLVYSMMMGSQMLSILMSGNTLRSQFEQRGYHAEQLLQVIGDAPELLPAVIPWNLLGLQTFAILKVPTLEMAPFAWFIYFTLGFSVIRTFYQWRAAIFVNGKIT